jgi:Secretion system C-terminal sorting domain
VPYEGCVGEPFQALAGAGAGNASYEFTLMGPNSTQTVTSTTTEATVTPTEVGVHDLMLVTSNGCTTASAQVSGYLTVFAEPVFTLNTANAVQGGALGSAFLSGVSNVNSITWLDANNQPLSANDTILNLPAGNYNVVVTNGDISNACTTTQTFIIDLTNGVDELAALGVKLYPNPANNKLFIDFTGKNLNALNAQVYNSTGALVLSQSLNGNALAEVDVATLPTGIYYLRIAAGNKLFATTWMKE